MTATTTYYPNFSKMNTIGNFKAIGWATRTPVDTCHGEMDFEFVYECEEELSESIVNELQDKVFNYTNCNHCGARMRNLIIVKDIDTDSIHVVGSDCGENVSMFGNTSSRLKGQTLRSAKITKGIKDMNRILEANIGLSEALKSNNKTVKSINENFRKFKKLSVKQIELVFKMAEKQKEYDIINADVKPIDFTKITNEKVEVISTKAEEVCYGYQNSVVVKVLIRSVEHGWKLYGNIGSGFHDVQKGTILIFGSNDITVSKDDKTFGFFKRGGFKTLHIQN